MEQRSNFLQILKVIFLILSSDTWIAADRGRKRYFNGGEREREREMVRVSDLITSHHTILQGCSSPNTTTQNIVIFPVTWCDDEIISKLWDNAIFIIRNNHPRHFTGAAQENNNII